jgi:CHAD domain-containing protein
MSLNRQSARGTCTRFERQLLKLEAKPASENVHHFRTCGRRVEALFSTGSVQPKRNEKKLLKLLAQLRKKAGKVRDLDVQIAALRNLKIPDDRERKFQLMQALSDERTKRQSRLLKAFDEETIRELRKRLKRAKAVISDELDPLKEAKRHLSALKVDVGPVTEEMLHQYRIAGKRARYLAELSKDPEAVHMVEILKRMQDVIGDWHDWMKLSERAEERFGRQSSALLSALRNVTQAKFHQAVRALEEARAALAAKKAASTTSSTARPAATARMAAAVA